MFASKRLAIVELSRSNRNLVFEPPDASLLYDAADLEWAANQLVGSQIPRDLGLVAKSQWVKYRLLSILGYDRSAGLRTSIAKRSKPKFLHQVMDVFVQSSDNLQVWNYLPGSEIKLIDPNDIANPLAFRFRDMRLVLIFHNLAGEIRRVHVAKGSEAAAWGTSTPTTKWQATITRASSRSLEPVISSGPDQPTLAHFIGQDRVAIRAELARADALNDNPLVHESPARGLVLPIEAVAAAVEALIGSTIPITARGHRVDAQEFERRLAVSLGYTTHGATHRNDYPDLKHQLLEAKLQTSPTIDLGLHLPLAAEPFQVFDGVPVAPSDIRYLVGLVEPLGAQWRIKAIAIATGAHFQDLFSLCEGQNFKVQLRVPPTIWQRQ